MDYSRLEKTIYHSPSSFTVPKSGEIASIPYNRMQTVSSRGAHQVWPAYQNLEFWFHFFRENIFKIFSDFAKSEKYFFLFFWLQNNEVRNKKYYISDFGKWSQKNIKKYFSDLAKSEKYLFLFFWFHFFQIRMLILTSKITLS